MPLVVTGVFVSPGVHQTRICPSYLRVKGVSPGRIPDLTRSFFSAKQQGFLPIHFKANAGKRLTAFRCRINQTSKRFIAASYRRHHVHDHIASASTSALHSSACRGDDQIRQLCKGCKNTQGKREQDSIECASVGEKRLASTSTSVLLSSECRTDDRPGNFAKRAKIPWQGNLSRRSKRASAAKRKQEEETEVEASLRLSSQSQRKQDVLSHEKLGERNYRLYCKSVYTYSLKSKRKLSKGLQDNKKAATSIRRSQETTAKKTARNAAKAAATSIRRSQESMAEKTARHAADAAATSTARALESSAQGGNAMQFQLPLLEL
ncbi:unnamed protein product [Acanthosepion pharaonis]|uniref:Uncharacterized protein n=1 Tax=Acanthosepion pharaonis TaxID=158019 RepID=A0A812BGU0_ACAPH|nr:unnamed protein product [Sepia pharaonis]